MLQKIIKLKKSLNMDKLLKFENIIPSKKLFNKNNENFGNEQKELLEELNNFLIQKEKYESLKNELNLNREIYDREEYEEKLDKIEEIKNGLIGYCTFLQSEFFPEYELNEIYTYDQIEKMIKQTKNLILKNNGIELN